jgi:hypothetical protein
MTIRTLLLLSLLLAPLTGFAQDADTVRILLYNLEHYTSRTDSAVRQAHIERVLGRIQPDIVILPGIAFEAAVAVPQQPCVH